MTNIHPVDAILFIGAGASTPLGYKTTDQFITEVRNMSLGKSEKEVFDFFARYPNITIEDIIRALDLRIKESKDPLLKQEAFSPHRTTQDSLTPEATQKLDELFSSTYASLKNKIVSQLYIAYGDKPELDKAWEIYQDYIHVIREQNDNMVPIFTTNYDKVIESLENIPGSSIDRVVRGFKELGKNEPRKGTHRNPIWSPEEAFDQEPGVDKLFLFKLHGSLNWRRDIYHELREAEEGLFELRGYWRENVLIPPGTYDFQYGEPYQSLRTYFEGYLGKARTCVVIGYRFDDPTIRDIFIRSLERDLRLIILNPEAEKIKTEKFPQFDKIKVIPKKIEEGVADLKEALRLSEAPIIGPEVKTPPTALSEAR